MTIFSNLLVCILCATLKLATDPNGWAAIDSNLFTFFFRGSFQRLYETLFPKSIAFQLQVRKRKKHLLAQIYEIVSHMSEDEFQWMREYFLRTEETLKKSLKENNSFEWDSATKEIWMDQKKAEKYSKQVCDDWIRQINKEQTASFKLGGENFTTVVLETDMRINGVPMPDSVKEIVCIINDYVFELKYMHMSSTNKDMIQVIKYMMDDGNEKLLNKLQERLDIIMQWNVREGGEVGMSNVSSIAAKDPYCFVRLVCPRCHASGNAIRRNGSSAECTVCDERYEIIKNLDPEDEIQKLIVKKSDQLRKDLYESVGGLRHLFEDQTHAQTRQIKDKMEDVVDRVLTEMYSHADGLFRELSDQNTEIDHKLQKSLDDAESRLSQYLEKYMDEQTQNVKAMIQESLRNVNCGQEQQRLDCLQRALDEAEQTLQSRIEQAAQNQERHLQIMEDKLDDCIDLIRKMVTENKIQDDHKLSEIRQQWEKYTMELMRVTAKQMQQPPAPTHSYYCSLCNMDTESVDGQQCPRCDRHYGEALDFASMTMSYQEKKIGHDTEKVYLLKLDKNPFEGVVPPKPVDIQLFVDRGIVQKIMQNNETSDASITYKNESDVRRALKEWGENNKSPHRVILVNDGADNVSINCRFLNMMQSQWIKTANEVICGENVSFVGSFSSSEWVIDKEKKKVRRKEKQS